MAKNSKNLVLIKGLTLIELMVVISIIGILAAVGMGSYQSSLKSARDGKRKVDIKQIRSALEMYYADYGTYPPSPCGYDCNGYYYSTGGNDWIPGLAQYVGGRLPVDPVNNGAVPWGVNGYTYAYGNVGRYTYPGKFDLTAQLENPNDRDRCAVKCWKFYFINYNWCPACGGGYNNQIYEDSPE